MLAMGVFVGLLVTQGMDYAKDIETYKKILTVVLSSSFGGVVVAYIGKQLDKKEAIPMYPVGLLLGYVWLQIPKLAALIIGGSTLSFWLGVLGMVGSLILTIVAVAVIVIERLRR